MTIRAVEPWEIGPPPDRFDDEELVMVPPSRPVDRNSDVFGREPRKLPPPPWLGRVVLSNDAWFTTEPPPRSWLLRDLRCGGAGVLPLGKVALLVAEGGAGKTMVLIQLAISVASHEPTPWLGCYAVPNQGRALAILGEEDGPEVHRRAYQARRAIGAPIPEPGSIVVIPLSGLPCAMIETDERGNPISTGFLAWLLAYVKEHGPFAVVIVDPLSRFAGAEAETDNAAATRFVQALESIATETGAAVVCAHHTNKTARAAGAAVTGASSRGSSALFFDGVRWVATMAAERIEPASSDEDDDGAKPRATELVTLTVVKSNYSGKGDPVTLRRDSENGGALVPLSATERAGFASARDAADPSARRREAREGERREREEREAARAATVAASRQATDSARQADEDATLEAILTERPELKQRELRAAMASRCAHGCGHARVDRALERRRMRLETAEATQ